jgi:hypothetical protein
VSRWSQAAELQQWSAWIRFVSCYAVTFVNFRARGIPTCTYKLIHRVQTKCISLAGQIAYQGGSCFEILAWQHTTAPKPCSCV